jgi:hypothetical protein
MVVMSKRVDVGHSGLQGPHPPKSSISNLVQAAFEPLPNNLSYTDSLIGLMRNGSRNGTTSVSGGGEHGTPSYYSSYK